MVGERCSVTLFQLPDLPLRRRCLDAGPSHSAGHTREVNSGKGGRGKIPRLRASGLRRRLIDVGDTFSAGAGALAEWESAVHAARGLFVEVAAAEAAFNLIEIPQPFGGGPVNIIHPIHD